MGDDAAALRSQLALLAAGVRDCVLADSAAACAAAAAGRREQLGAGVGVLRWDAHGNAFLVRLDALAARLRADEARLARGEQLVAVPVRAHAAARRPCVLSGDARQAWLQRLATCVRALSAALQDAASAVGGGGGAPPARAVELAMPDALPLCPVALTGYLLGYPVVYDVSGGDGRYEPGANCLGGCTLHVHRAEWRGDPDAVLAFSVPVERDVDGTYAPVEAALAAWTARLQHDADRTQVPVVVTSRDVTLAHVAL